MLPAFFQRFVNRLDFSGRFVGLGVVLALAACQPKIGDDCTTSADCSNTGDRLCDKTQKGGYCTVFNCEPGTCPEEAACIAFGSELSTIPMCHTGTGSSPYQRTFCMLTCESSDDCRGDYECIDMKKPDNPWGAIVVERKGSGKVCVQPFSAAPVDTTLNANVCQATGIGGSPTGGDFSTLPAASGGAGGAGGNAGAGGSSGGTAGVGGAEAGAAGEAGGGASSGGASGSSGAGGLSAGAGGG